MKQKSGFLAGLRTGTTKSQLRKDGTSSLMCDRAWKPDAPTADQFTQSVWQVFCTAQIDPPRQITFFEVGSQMRQRSIVPGSQTRQGDVQIRVLSGTASERPTDDPGTERDSFHMRQATRQKPGDLVQLGI